jgi:hypothetical protein
VIGLHRTADIGAFISVATEADLTTIDVSPLTLGTFAFVFSEAVYFQLIADGDDLAWTEVVFGGGTAHTSAPVTGDGSSGSPITMAAATDSTAGAMSAADKTRADANVLPASQNLGDASTTVNPGSDAASQYVMAGSTMTANRTVTLGTSGSPVAGLLVQVLRGDLSANTLEIDGGSGALFTFGASPTAPQAATFQYSGSAWAFVAFYFVG